MPNTAKHRKQCTAQEIAAVENFVHSIKNWTQIPHAVERQKERVFTVDDVINTLRVGDMIEVHANNYPDIRVAMRYDVNDNASCCVAASLVNHAVVSVWFNHPSDIHDTLDMNKYRWQADLRQVIQTIKEGKQVTL